MKEPINYQVIKDNGEPAFAVVPYPEFKALLAEAASSTITADEEVTFPHMVARMIAVDEMSPIKAWRIYLGKTQAQLAEDLKITQPAVAQLEHRDAKVQIRTLFKVAAALGVDVEQLRVD